MSALEQSPRITPFLWFDNNAEQAVDFYLSIFPNSRRLEVMPAPEAAHAPSPVLTIAFELDGQRLIALNGGPAFQFTEAISFVVRCESQEEIDRYWSRLTESGSEVQCGWLKDKFGLFWQIIPSRLPTLLRHPAAFQAMLGMKKIDLGALERAAQTPAASS